ncbi:MAG: ATP-dependent Clp protease proteolytic subunit [Lachnospiraceae bacterium]|nr:ATP-dependent Clp protease proteolytic subunit [Lachnospiraceae bacterium]
MARSVIMESVRGLVPIHLDDVLMRDRNIFLCDEVTSESCNEIIKELLYMESVDDGKPINLFINSPGGSVTDGLAVYDVITLLKSPVNAIVTGLAASMGSIILLACSKERRFMLPSSRILVHDCSWGHNDLGGKKPYEVEEELKQLKSTNERLVSIIAERTGKTVKEVAKVTKYDSYFSAQEAIDFGLASKIIDSETLSSLMKKGA